MTKMITSGQIICTLKTQQYLFIVPPCEFYFGRNKDKQNNIAVKKKQKQNKKQESKHHAYINMYLIKMIFQHRTQYQFIEIVSNPQ